MDLWVLGKFQEDKQWELQGVFDDEQKAIDACLPSYFIGKVVMNERLPDETIVWKVSYPKGG